MRAKNFRPLSSRSRQRGAALIITVIVIMVLMTLGLAMVAFTTTEERTATTYRDGLQAREVAMAGINIAAEMFRNPTNHNLVPLFSSNSADCTATPALADYCGTDEATTETSLNTIGIWRAVRGPVTPARYTGNNNKFFLGPFSNGWGQTFGGVHSSSSDLYDVSFECRTVPSTSCWLDKQFNALLQASTDWNQDTGKITKISFYAAPDANGVQYGICTVRVTAIKTDANTGAVLARETLEAVIGDLTPRPAVLGNGNVTLDTSGGSLCGDGCEAVHANGNVTVGSIDMTPTPGQSPFVTATGTVTGAPTGTGAGGKPVINPPKINPWDLAYKPTNATDLNNYYLVTARPLDAVWTDGIASNNPAPRPCGINQLSLCQDYNLEYDTAGNPKPARTATMTPFMYKWNAAANEWTQCASGTTLNTCAGAPSFSVTRVADLPVSGTGDDADIPYNTTRVPQTVFTFTGYVDGTTVLIDGQTAKGSAGNAHMAVITVGSQTWHASTTWYPPSATNLIMWISGRDISSNSNCCAPSNTCLINLTNPGAQGIIAAHEQIYMHAQVALAGIVIGENKVDFDTTVSASATGAIYIDRGDHAYTCGRPEWPWNLPVTPAVLSVKSVTE